MPSRPSRRRTLTAAAMVALAANPVQSQFVLPMAPLLQARMDPVVLPGMIGGHVHTILGASNFRSVLNTPAEQLDADCTTNPLQADKSNYWTPTLYFINKDNKYEPMTANHNRAYYFIPNGGENVRPFPPGFRMIAGTSSSRDYTQNDQNTVRYEVANDQLIATLPTGSDFPDGAPGTLHIQIEFPSCGWANQSLDSGDHRSHMAYPIKAGGGNRWFEGWTDDSFCPETHPIRYPHIHLQTNYDLSQSQKDQWRKGAGQLNLILSNGDTQGGSWHADFVNGWDASVLQAAINDKNCHGVGSTLENCSAFKGHLATDSERMNCRLQGAIPNEDVGYFTALDQLPGCNPRWDKGMDDSNRPTDCPWHTSEPGFAIPTVMFQEYGRENGWPTVCEKNADGTYPVPPLGTNPIVTPWGVDGKTRFALFANTVLTESDASLAPNFASGTSDVDYSAGLKDSAAFSDVGGTNVLAEKEWQIIAGGDPDSYTTTWMVGENWLGKNGQKTAGAVDADEGAAEVTSTQPATSTAAGATVTSAASANGQAQPTASSPASQSTTQAETQENTNPSTTSSNFFGGRPTGAPAQVAGQLNAEPEDGESSKSEAADASITVGTSIQQGGASATSDAPAAAATSKKTKKCSAKNRRRSRHKRAAVRGSRTRL